MAPSARALTKGPLPVHLGARALDILIALVARAGRVVSNAELVAIVWPNTYIEQSALRVHISALRKAIGDGRSGTRFIVGVRGRGYAFVAKVELISANGFADIPRTTVPDRRDYVSIPLVKIIGRDEIVGQIAGQLLRKRFVTITGTGGIGKTSVALAIAQTLASTFRDGMQLVELGSLASPLLVAAHLASLLHLRLPDTQPLPYVVAQLRTRNMLIVFNDCEHVIAPVSEVAEAILQAAPDVYILATSREPLRAMGEWVQRLEPLAVPPILTELTVAEALRFPAVQLFTERALACDGSYQLTDTDAPLVAEICTRLDGLPLAIELAATRVSLFGLRGLAGRLDDRFSILTVGRRTALPRHRTLAAMIDWSHETLSDDEKIVWRRLSVFHEPFTIEAADRVANDRLTENFNIVDILDGLVEKSLVSVDSRGGETARYRLLESLRLYAFNKLVQSKEAERARRRHAQCYERSVEPGGNCTERPSTEPLRKHGDNVADNRAALKWSLISQDDSRLVIGTAI